MRSSFGYAKGDAEAGRLAKTVCRATTDSPTGGAAAAAAGTAAIGARSMRGAAAAGTTPPARCWGCARTGRALCVGASALRFIAHEGGRDKRRICTLRPIHYTRRPDREDRHRTLSGACQAPAHNVAHGFKKEPEGLPDTRPPRSQEGWYLGIAAIDGRLEAHDVSYIVIAD